MPMPEEERHPWGGNRFPTFRQPFLRIWDSCSGNTFESRKTSLTIHVNHNDWTPTPYISFTTSADAREARGRGRQTLTVVNPNVRLVKGLPILDIAAEMAHYGVQDPYRKSNQYYVDHYLCVWEVSEQEVIGRWQWKDLAADGQWYENTIQPAFRKHNRQIEPSSTAEDFYRVTANSVKVRDLYDTQDLYYGDSDASSEGLTCIFEGEPGWSDTDDEVEEANAADDMI
ncbi:hypothetical protein B0J12DRAFT_722342 [Macrophomina phaseolina]|uniref:Uncharacterized protein n=1 Tax=Macrophomina phaseolina TaxID=35725 RepID=A0ABQ8FSJ7_9PEZI|nr:hypothetical protein B0J12DRAFT_722342 [Macrophomina phaseolina]